jgi:uncharacterized membrane protein
MKIILTSYVVTALVFLAIDAVWLTLAADLLYRPLLGDKLLAQFKLAPAAIFYLIYIAGIVMLAILPAFRARRGNLALLNGAALGFVAYATYDLTNQATLTDWPVIVTVADMIWGTFLTATASLAGYVAARRVGG